MKLRDAPKVSRIPHVWRIESIHSNFKQLSKILYFIFLRRCIASENWDPQTTKLLLLLLQSLQYPCLKAKTCNSIYRTWTIREQHKKKHKNAKRMMKKTRGHQSWLALLSFGPVIYPLICALAPCLLAPWAAAVAIHTIQSQKNHHKVINFLCVLLDLHQQERTTWCLLLKRAIVGGWVCGCFIPSSPCPGYDSVDISLSISNS